MPTNHQFRLAARPSGLPKRSDWNLTEEPVRDPGPGEVLIKVEYVSLDPAMRGWMNEGRSYIEPVKIGDVMRAGAAGRVIASQNPAFALGDHVTGILGVQEYALLEAKAAKGLNKVDTKLAPLPVYMSALGMTGLTAYFGLLEVGQPQARRLRGRLGRCRRHGHGRRPDRQDQGMPGDRHRRRPREMPLRHRSRL